MHLLMTFFLKFFINIKIHLLVNYMCINDVSMTNNIISKYNTYIFILKKLEFKNFFINVTQKDQEALMGPTKNLSL